MAESLAQRERAELSQLLAQLGPDAPTICTGWRTRDLASHLWLRESKPLAAAGMFVPFLAGERRKAEAEAAAFAWPELIAKVADGPPKLSPFGLPQVDALANSNEFFIHHEDVRRGQPDWQPRIMSRQDNDKLWSGVGVMGLLGARKAPVGVTLRRSDTDAEKTLLKKSEQVIVVGEPGELLMFVTGRGEHAKVEFIGSESAVAALKGAKFSL